MLGVFVAATNQSPQTPAIVASNVVEKSAITAPADPLEAEYQKLLALDDTAQAEVDKWIRDNQAFVTNGGGVPDVELNRRIEERLKPVRQAYENFIALHPDHARVRIAYGSFLNDIREEEAAGAQWEKARALDPKNSAVWNNLANYYGEHGPVTNAFGYYNQAIALNPEESVYYHNFGTTVYLFRKDAMEYFHLTEPQVFDKAFNLYSNAFRLDPQNFPLASDIAQTYYGIQPFRTNDALRAWTNALAIAHDEIEREGVYLHFARIHLKVGNFAAAHARLNAVTNAMYAELKKRLTRNLEAKENPSPVTNAAPLGGGEKGGNTSEPPRGP